MKSMPIGAFFLHFKNDESILQIALKAVSLMLKGSKVTHIQGKGTAFVMRIKIYRKKNFGPRSRKESIRK